MLGSEHFYYRTMRKVIIAFGALFNGIEIVKSDANTQSELPGRMTVPVVYENKETWYTRLTADPDLLKGVQIQLPAMTYEMTSITYDPARKISGYLKNTIVQTGNNAIRYSPAFPYNMSFELNIYVRNIEDGNQIIEQIIPFFGPDYVLSLKYLSEPGNNTAPVYVTEELPIVLESVRYSNDYEGPAGTVRVVTWTLDFTAKPLFFGPIPQTGVVKEVFINLRDEISTNVLSTINTAVVPFSANSTDSYNVVTTITETK